MTTPPELRSIDQMLSLADNGDYLPDLLERIEANSIEMRQFAQDFQTAAKGKITLTIEMKLDRFGQLEMAITDKVDGPKPPKHKAVCGGVTYPDRTDCPVVDPTPDILPPVIAEGGTGA